MHKILVFALTVILALCFLSCPTEGEESNPEGTGIVVAGFDLSGLINRPIPDGIPTRIFSGGEFYSGSITWKSGDGSVFTGYGFLNNVSYTAVVTLTPKTGYRISGVSGSFTHNGGQVTFKRETDNVVITVIFPVTSILKVNKLDFTDLITAPVTGQNPQAANSNDQYFFMITWMDSDKPHTGIFEVGTGYTAVLTFIPEPGYSFEGITSADFSHPEAQSLIYNPATGKLTIIFKPTEKVGVSLTDLSGLILTPVPGGRPQADFSNVQYSGLIEWKDEAGNPFTGTFILGDKYTAAAVLIPTAGYSFTGFTGTFRHDFTDSISHVLSGDDCIVTIVFPATKEPVSSFNLTSLFAAPVTGQTPVSSFSHAQYTGTINWIDMDGNPAGGTFARFKLYRANITFTATGNYTFTGSNLAFTHSDRVTNISVVNTYISAAQAEAIITFDTVTGFQACCWHTSSWNIRNLFDNNISTVWEYPRSSSIGSSSWPGELIIPGVLFDGNECGKGHPEALKLQGLQPAHFFTFDFGESKDILSFEFQPRPNDNPFGLIDIYVSNNPIGVNPANSAGIVKVVKDYDFKVTDLGQWYGCDIAEEYGSVPSGRYVQIRVKDIYDRNNLAGGLYGASWISPSVSEMRVNVSE